MICLNEQLKDFLEVGNFDCVNYYMKMSRAGICTESFLLLLIDVYCRVHELYNSDHTKIRVDNNLRKIFAGDVILTTDVPNILKNYYKTVNRPDIMKFYLVKDEEYARMFSEKYISENYSAQDISDF